MRKKHLLVSNPSENRVVLPKGMKVGFTQKVEVMEEHSQIDLKDKLNLKEARLQLQKGSLTRNEQKKVWRVMKKYAKIFKQQVQFNDIGNRVPKAKIQVQPGTRPIIEQMGQMNPLRHEAVDNEMRKLEQRGMIVQLEMESITYGIKK
jgi:hypothetical protein